jgi:acetyl-CoA synthetase
MSTIESVSREARVFEPPRAFVAQANVTKADFDRLNAAAAADFPGFWAKLARDEVLWHKPFSGFSTSQGAVLQMVRGR